MVLNAAVQMLREAEELKQKILKFKSGTSMLQERDLWVTQQQLQKVYQKVLVLDLDYALDKKVEQDLWNVGFKQQIEALQAIAKDKKNALRSEGQAMLTWVLQAAAGFYLCLLHQICTTFKLDLPFRRRASLLGWVEGWGAAGGEAGAGGAARVALPPPAAARYICQHCLVHLGDLARYRQQLRVAHTFYRHALLVSAHSGQPYNQLALVAWRRGGQLSALYWHVRSLLVRAPFPPAPANLARTLAAAAAAATAASRDREFDKDSPVILGVTTSRARLDAHSYVDELIRALHYIHTMENLDVASQLVNRLNSSLTSLVATDSFESMTLVKMACVVMWVVHTSCEGEAGVEAGEERGAARLARQMAAGAILALLLPAYTRTDHRAHPSLPALKVWLTWVCSRPQLLLAPELASRPQLWAALAHTLTHLAAHTAGFQGHLYASIPLPEDEELHGFLPLEQGFAGLKFSNYASWDTYGDRIPDYGLDADADGEHDQQDGDREKTNFVRAPSDVTEDTLSKQPELEHKIRAHRLVQLGHTLAALLHDAGRDHFTVTSEVEGLDPAVCRFTASSLCGERLQEALAELSPAGSAPAPTPSPEPPAAPPPLIISEADFREKVREKRVGILKPQGSLERAREERALATNTQDELEAEGSENSDKGDESKKEAPRKSSRMNVAMAAILRKQEETNKQVKFVTPATTPDSTADGLEASQEQDKPKIIQPKAIKSLANLPIGRKTGGILSLKDKSAGYPHLVNAEPEPVKNKSDKEDKKHDNSKGNSSSQHSQQGNYSAPKLRQELHPSSPNWTNNIPNTFNSSPRMTLQQKSLYGIQNAGINFNPSYQQAGAIGVNNQGIRLPVVNPKEIDVRSAALQKQNSRQEPFQDGPKFNYQLSGDKKNFLNDLPPRFANQYRYWQQQSMQNDNQFNNASQDSKFAEDSFKNTNFSNNNFAANVQQPNSRPNWMMNPPPPIAPDNYTQQQMSWWKPESVPPNYSSGYAGPSMNVQPNYFAPHMPSNLSNPYQNPQSFTQGLGPQTKPDSLNLVTPNYLQSTIGQPPLQNLQSMVTSSNFNSSLNSFGTYGQAVGYDSNMYPQFSNNKLGYPQPMKMPDKQMGQMNPGLSFGGSMMGDLQQRSNMNYNEAMNNDNSAMKNRDQMAVVEVEQSGGGGSTYSLFSGAQESSAWGPALRQPQQSLWSGPGPSPLERLLEQQKHVQQPPNEPQ